MENKLNKTELENYAKKLSSKLCSDYFSISKTSITGSEILKFTPITQVNYFILKEVFFKWKNELNNLKTSPFFDYSHPEVQESLNNLMKVLSNHINIQKDEFEKLLSSSIEETIYLVMSPYHYFKQYFFVTSLQKISFEDLKSKAKYVKLNDVFFKRFIEKLEVYRVQHFYISDIMGYFQEAYYNTNDQFQDYEPIIEQFNALLPFPMDKIVTDVKKKDDYAPTPLEVYEASKAPKEESESNKMISPNLLKPIKLGLNEKIMFTKELFNGDSALFEATMSRIVAAGNWNSAKSIIDYLKLDKENEIVQEFYEIVEARFKF
jgi:hypothetical protein